MAIQICESSFLEKRVLKIEPRGVRVLQTVAFGRGQAIPFERIDYVLLADNGLLSIQYGREVFKIRTSASNKKHAAAMTPIASAHPRQEIIPVIALASTRSRHDWLSAASMRLSRR